MPQKNSIKEYSPDTFYHIYNRGVEKRKIFLDKQDYSTFLSYLKFYLISPKLQGVTLKLFPSRVLKNYAEEIELHCFCLMPNHFHLLVNQLPSNAIHNFMKSLLTRYSMYFNKRYRRVGKLFQGPYKAVKIATDEQLLYLTKYIHLNPKNVTKRNYEISSLNNYYKKISQPWVETEEILSYFSSTNPKQSYKAFIEEKEDMSIIAPLSIDY